MKKIVLTITVIVLLIIASLTAVTVAYSYTEDYKNECLPKNTRINGIDCSGLTYMEAAATLTEAWNSKHVLVTGSLNEELAAYTDFGCTYDINKQLRKLKHDNIIPAALNHYIGTPVSAKMIMIVKDYDPAFKETVISSDFLDNPDATETQDAYVDVSDPSFPIVKEVYGTKIDKDKFFNDILKHIQSGKMKFIFNERDYHFAPKITADDPKLIEYQNFCKKYLNQKITYEMGKETFTLTSQQLASMLKSDMSGETDPVAVRAFVDQMADTYNNVGAERNFKSFSGKQIKVRGGTYGWIIDREKEAAQLESDIKSHKDVSRKPVYSFESYGDYTRTMGNTYIDVDVSSQIVRYYENGELKFTSPCVTGNRARGTTTSIGTYYILNKVRNVVLRGDDYESPVKYWMGVTWGGQGFHDANWRSSFGGKIWLTNGSHGCINMPPNRIPTLYNMVEPGTPVIIHY